ncbi:MAG: 1-acyl-sn-glycerol-3-phosphate acyltransferase [Crocinitomicaceae bacterium]|nr:1-acyl-sn-glycerol-3-phosphate acyltransferase [Crocinitomicaceae bacterium]
MKNAKLPKAPFVVVANHISYLDIFLMYSILPQSAFLFLGKSEILRYPIIGTYFKRLNIPVFRDSRVKSAKSLIQASREVKKGWSLIIFPEGGIPDRNPKLDKFKGGAFQLAKSTRVPIVPITFTNNHRLFSDPSFILGIAHPGLSRVYIHEYLSVSEIEKMSQDELMEHCFQTINEPLLYEYPELKLQEN